jgi:iron(III) transport system permease protein
MAAPPASMMSTQTKTFRWVVLIVFVVLVIPPILEVLFSGVHPGYQLFGGPDTLSYYSTLLSSSSTYTVLWSTAKYGALTSVFSTILAAYMAWLIQRRSTPLRRVMFFCLIAAFVIPAIVQTIGWTFLIIGPRAPLNVAFSDVAGWLGFHNESIPYSLFTMVFVQSMILIPALVLLLRPAFASVNLSLEEAGRIYGASRAQVMRKITVPLMMPALFSALLLGFVFAVESFEVPALIGLPGRIIVLSTEIFVRTQQEQPPDYSTAGVYATMLMVLTILALYLYSRAIRDMRHLATVGGKTTGGHAESRGWARWLTFALGVLIVLCVVAPALMVIWLSFLPSYMLPSTQAFHFLTFSTYRQVFDTPGTLSSIYTTLEIGLVAGFIVTLLSVLGAWVTVRTRGRLGRSVEQVSLLPLTIPGLVLSLAILRTYISVPVLYGTIVPLVIAFVVHFLPIGMRFNLAGMISIGKDLEEAAAVSGATTAQRLRRVVAPLMAGSVAGCFVFVVLASLQQLPIALFLTTSNLRTVPVTMFSLWEAGSINQVSALAGMVLVIILVLTIPIYRALDQRGLGV